MDHPHGNEATPRGQAQAVLVSGFGPFPGVEHNPTASLIARLQGTPLELGAGWQVGGVEFPTVLEGLAQRLMDARRATQPAWCLHLGVHGRATALHVERTAHNALAFGRPDAAGALRQDTPVMKGGPSAWQTGFDVDQLVVALRDSGLPAQVSDDPGRYLCNALYALSLAAHAPPALFLHVPMPGAQREDGQGEWTDEDLWQALLVTLHNLHGQWLATNLAL